MDRENRITEQRLEEFTRQMEMERAYREKCGEWSTKVKPEKLNIGKQRNVATR